MTDALAMFADLFRAVTVFDVTWTIDADGVRKKSASPSETASQAVSPQPLQAQEMQLLPEGARVSDYRKTWARLLVEPGDEIEFTATGERFVVFQQDPWGDYGNFYRYVIRNIRADEEFMQLDPGPV
jgi:hypothetical protein